MKRNKYFLWLLLIILLLSACNGLAGRRGAATSPLAEITVPARVSEQADALATQAASVAATAAGGATAIAAAGEADSVVATAVAQGETLAATAQSAAGQIPGVDINALKERFSSVQPDENGNVSVTITDDELNQAIQASQAAAAQAGSTLQIQNAQATFSGGNIILAGNVTEPVAADLSVSFRPDVANGTLQFEVVSATVGGVTVPPLLLQSAEATLNNTLGEAMSNLPAQVVLQDVVVGEGTLTVLGGRA